MTQQVETSSDEEVHEKNFNDVILNLAEVRVVAAAWCVGAKSAVNNPTCGPVVKMCEQFLFEVVTAESLVLQYQKSYVKETTEGIDWGPLANNPLFQMAQATEGNILQSWANMKQNDIPGVIDRLKELDNDA